MTDYLAPGLNGVFSVAIIFVCVCRLAKIDDNVLLRVGLEYIVMVMAAAGNGAAPWLFQLPGWPQTLFTGAVLFMLVADSFQWRHGPPSSTTAPAELFNMDGSNS